MGTNYGGDTKETCIPSSTGSYSLINGINKEFGRFFQKQIGKISKNDLITKDTKFNYKREDNNL